MSQKKIIASYLSAGMLMLLPLTSHAAGLGKLSVRSALGQPLNAEIELLARDKSELEALSARLAGNDAFREAKIDPAAALYNLKFAVDKKPDGRAVLKITSSKPINDPFLDMLIELDWATGRIVREYTVLLDPPGMTAAQTPVSPLEVNSASTSGNESGKSAESSVETKPSSSMGSKTTGGATSTRKSAQAAEKTTKQSYGPVKRGDTLSSIASQTKPDGVNLEQMLIGLYRENRKAFDGDNMNRLKTGKILKVPSKEQIAAIPVAEAARDIKLQSADWQSYRQKLAGEVAQGTAVPEKSAQAVGKIMPKVEDKAAQMQAGKDVLTLSKGEAPANGKQLASGKDAKQVAATQDKLNALQEDAAAQKKALQDANNRVAALEKNIQDMQRLLDIKSQALAELQKNAAKAGSNAAPAAESTQVMPPVAAPAAVKPATPPAQTATVPKPVVPTPAPMPASAGPSWYENINPLYLGGGALAALLLALLAFMMHGKRKRKGLSNFEDSIMAGTDIRANTVFGTQGGGAVNTNNTSFLTDFSQAGLGTIDTHDVDPIAEAEVYMAYGRDAQAEEILKEALTKDPGRHEIHLKLLEIYAARKNLPAFESVATELYAALGGEMTPVWAKAAELGRKLDPNNPLYNNTGEASHIGEVKQSVENKNSADAVVVAAGMATVALASRRRAEEDGDAPPASGEIHSDAAPDFSHNLNIADVDAADAPIDRSLDFTSNAEQGIIADAIEKHAAHEDSVFHDLDSMMVSDTDEDIQVGSVPHDELDFPDLDFATHDFGSRPASAPLEPAKVNESGLDFDFDLPEPEAPLTSPDSAADLDFSDISLDLNDIGDMSQAAGEPDEAFQEAATKLDLARVYHEMGDKENAREILQEVIQEGNPTQKEDAQMLLAQIG